MAHEAVLVVETGPPITFACDDSDSFEKGAFAVLEDEMKADPHADDDTQSACAGIVASEKVANNGITHVSIYREGIFRAWCSGTVAIGSPIALSDTTNFFTFANGPSVSGSKIIGNILGAGGTNEQVLIDLNIGAGGSMN